MSLSNPHHGSPDLLSDIVSAAERFADRPALVIEDTTYSYRMLFSMVCHIRKEIGDRGGDTVGVVARNKVETYASILAVLMSGKTYVILHPDYPVERNRFISVHAGAELILDYGAGVLAHDVLPAEEVSVMPKSTDLPAYVIFTSGSTGEPKGVPVSRRNLNAFYAAYRSLGWDMCEEDRVLQMFQLTFDVSVVSFLYPLSVGACVYTVPDGGIRYMSVMDIIDRCRITFATVAPSVLRLMAPYFSEIHLPYLRFLAVTAEATDTGLADAFRPCIPNADIVNLYGPTEATIYCTSYRIPVQGCKQHNGIISIGRPFPGVEAVIEGDDGMPAGTGEKGELLIGGPQVMDGYWKDPGRTSESFVISADGKRFYRTGDICYMDADGDIMYCGRKDTQVKVQGYRVELGEIEHRARMFYRDRCHVAVIPVSRDGSCELHLAVDHAEGDREPLMAYLQSHLPPYMIPAGIHFIGTFPQNGSSKTDRKKIKEIITGKYIYDNR